MKQATVVTPANDTGAPPAPDLSRLSRTERKEIKRYCTGKLFREWRVWALLVGFAVVAGAMSGLTGTAFRAGGIWAGMAGGAAGGLVCGAVLSRILDRLARPHLGAELLRRGLCPRCAYDVRATPGGCPECGQPLDDATA